MTGSHASFWNALMPCRPALRMVPLAGVSTRFVVAGEANRAGGVVALVHGASGHLESFAYNIAALAEQQMVVAYDLPWHGLGSVPDRLYEIGDYVDHLFALLDFLDVDECSLVGHSLGAAIVARAVLRTSERVRRVVLIGAAGAEGDEYPGPGNMAEHLAPGPTAENIGRRLQLAMAPGTEVSEELLACRLATYAWGDWPTRVRAFTYHRVHDVWARNMISVEAWGRIACPALLVWGSEDRVISVDNGHKLVRWMPDARLELVDGAGHNPQHESPDEVNALMVPFLAPDSPRMVGDLP